LNSLNTEKQSYDEQETYVKFYNFENNLKA